MPNHWFKFYHSDWISGTRRLSPTTRAIYLDVLCMIYSAAGPIERDDEGMARECAVTIGTFKKSLAELLRLNKIVEKNGKIFNEKAAKNLEKTEEKSKSSSRAANKRWAEFNQQKQSPTDANALRTHEFRIQECDATRSQKLELEEERKKEPTVLSKEKRGTRIPENFYPDGSCHLLAEKLLLTSQDCQGALDNFIDYWRGVPAAKGVKLDWQATFRNQLRHISKQKGKPNGKSSLGHTLSVVDAIFDEAERRAGTSQGGDETDIIQLPGFREGPA